MKDKIETRGRQSGFKTHSHTNCIKCNIDFNDKNYCSKGMCKKCYNSSYRSRNNTPLYNKEYYLSKVLGTVLTKDECYKWVAKCYDKKFYIDMHGLSDLIHVYDSLGGSQQAIDDMKPGKQLQQMWNYVNNKFLSEYKTILDIEI